jgi:hypothetical protein
MDAESVSRLCSFGNNTNRGLTQENAALSFPGRTIIAARKLRMQTSYYFIEYLLLDIQLHKLRQSVSARQ